MRSSQLRLRLCAHDVRVINCRFDNVERPGILDHVEGLHLDRVTVSGRPLRG